MLVNICVIPTAKIKPGTAYPKESKSLNTWGIFNDLTLKLINKANKHVKNAARDATKRVLEAAVKTLLEKILSIWVAQLINSSTGKIKPMNTGRRQIIKAIIL